MPRFKTGLALVALLAVGAVQAFAQAGSKGSVETSVRLLEYDADRGTLIYDVSLRNLGRLPVTFVHLDSDPASEHGPLELLELRRGQIHSHRFSFQLQEDQFLFRPVFKLEFTDAEGRRVRENTSDAHLTCNVDFATCDVKAGVVTLDLSVSNVADDPMLFMELTCENPPLAGDMMELGDVSPGETIYTQVTLQLSPGSLFFHPTLHISYYAFDVKGAFRFKSFITMLQPDLRKVERELLMRSIPEG